MKTSRISGMWLLIVSLGIPALAKAEVPAPYVSDPQTALLYHYDETSGTTVLDSSGHNRNAVVGTGVTRQYAQSDAFGNDIQTSTGLTARATFVDSGQGRNSFLYTGGTSGTKDFTLEMWIRPTGDLSTVGLKTLAALQVRSGTGGDATTYDWKLGIINTISYCQGVALIDNVGYIPLTPSNGATVKSYDWQIGTWYHLALVVHLDFDNPINTYEKLYITPAGTATAVLVRTRNLPLNVLSANTNDRALLVGNYYGNNGNDYFPGEIDEVRWSTTARNPDDFRTTLGPSVPQQIRQEALAPNNPADCPLPLMSCWMTDWYSFLFSKDPLIGYNPAWQMEMISQGHHLLPWFQLPGLDTTESPDYPKYVAYYQSAMSQLAAWKLPLLFVGTQWESLLYNPNYPWLSKPYAENPNIVKTDLSVVPAVSGFGPAGAWSDVGNTWATSPLMQFLQTLYPDPPRVIFLSNNEANREWWSSAPSPNHVEIDKHYLDLYGTGQSDAFKREKLAQGWIERYRAMQQGWRNGLTNATWKSNSMFIAYGATGMGFLGRYWGWMDYSLYNTGRISPEPLMWDGGSYSYYVGPPYSVRDYRIWSLQVEALNLVFQQNETYQLNPGYWWEMSTWNGCDASPPPAWPTDWPGDYTPERYAGMVKFGMWLLRPRVVRHFTNWFIPRTQTQPWFDAQLAAVDQVHTNTTLKSFWRNSQLVANNSHSHPYQILIPPEYQSAARMFMLDTDADPANWWIPSPYPNYLYNPLPIYVMARVKGESPARQWLIYAYAPASPLTNVTVTIPDYTSVVLPTAAVGGSYYLLDESSTVVTPIE